MKIRQAYTFGDVLLEPKRTKISSRKTSLETRFSKNIVLNIPIVSANMDTVTEETMAKFMAENGGLGIIHRFLPIDAQADQVRRVKRTEGILIEEPYTISADLSIEDAANLMLEKNVSGLPVLSANNKLAGIITKRDVLFCLNLHGNKKISEAMTKKVITAPRGISLSDAKEILCNNHIKKLPLVAKENILVGLITLKDILKQGDRNIASKDKKGRLIVGAAIGIKPAEFERARLLSEAGADVLVIDTGHGHNDLVFDMLKKLKKKFAGIEIVCGNVATAHAAGELSRAGADGIKVGIGPGAACTTRIVTKVGVPQLTAINDCAKASKKFAVPICADGGISNSGDLAVAIAAGASSVMIGSLLAGTNESPGDIVLTKRGSFKRYRGMASRDAAEDKARIDGEEDVSEREPEGEKGEVPYTGDAQNILKKLLQGLRQSMYMQGAKNIAELQKNPKFIGVTPAGIYESQTRLDKS